MRSSILQHYSQHTDATHANTGRISPTVLAPELVLREAGLSKRGNAVIHTRRGVCDVGFDSICRDFVLTEKRNMVQL
jgi:hypothetical protein